KRDRSNHRLPPHRARAYRLASPDQIPKKQAINAAGHEIEPAERRSPAPMAARSSSTKVPRNRVTARANVDGLADGRISGLIRSNCLTTCRRGHRGCITLMFQSGRCHAESGRHYQTHQAAHDSYEGVVMSRMSDGIH